MEPPRLKNCACIFASTNILHVEEGWPSPNLGALVDRGRISNEALTVTSPLARNLSSALMSFGGRSKLSFNMR